MPGMIRGYSTDTRVASGYGAAQLWCVRCDVGWPRENRVPCWNCGLDDRIYAWGWRGPFLRWDRVTLS